MGGGIISNRTRAAYELALVRSSRYNSNIQERGNDYEL